MALAVSPTFAKQPPERVLFVGNSLTYYNDLPEMVRQISAADDQVESYEVEMLAAGGVSVAQHIEGGHLLTLLAEGNYTFVVFQDIGGWPICPPDSPGCSDSVASIEEISGLIKSKGAESVWYSTYQRIPAIQAALTEEARRIAKEFDIRLADVGAAWAQYESIVGEGAPFLEDGHPNRTGSFIGAVTVFKAIAGQTGASDIKLQHICSRKWQGTGLSEASLASKQEPPTLKCESLSLETQQNVLDAAK